MITKIIFIILLLTELFLATWNLKQKIRHDKEKMYTRLSLAALLILGLLTGILQGITRYQMLLFLLILQAALLALRLFILHKNPKPVTILRQIGRTLATLLLYFFALLPAFLFPQYKEPQVTGTHQVETVSYTWEDTNRLETYSDSGENRSVTVKIWYPMEEGNYPLVVFSHGATGMIDSNFSSCMELASNGYVVVSIGHPYQAIMVEDTDGNVTFIDAEFMNNVMTDDGSDTPQHKQLVYERSQEWLAVRCADMNFVIDTILEKKASGEAGPFAKVNPEKIGVFGHSLGGATSANVGRLRNDIDAVIVLEGTMFGEYTGCENGMYVFNEEPYPVPLLDVNSRVVYEDASNIAGQEYVNFYVGEHALDFHSAIFNGAGHLNFTDLPLVSPFLANMLGTGETDALTCIENMNEMILNYFDYYLKDAPELNLSDEY